MASDVSFVMDAYPRIGFACAAREVRDAAAGRVLSAHQAHLLRHLDPVDPSMVTELADHMGVTPSTMSLNLTRLERSGFVVRERDPEDRRVMNVRLSEAGQRVRERMTELDPDRVAAMLRVFGPEDRRRALLGLTLLAEAADALVAGGGR